MTPKPHPIRHTLLFYAAVLVAVLLFMARPASFDGTLADWPRFEAGSEDAPTMTAQEAQDILQAYTETTSAPLLPPALDTALQQATEVPKAKEATPADEPLEKWPLQSGAYDRAAVGQFLHPNLQLQGSDRAFAWLGNFFTSLNESHRKPPIHVIHYGDSQIEGDRITGYLRNAWQAIWGGGGPGLLSPLSPVPSLAMRQSWTGSWNRHARFGKRDSTVEHTRYGLMAAFAQPLSPVVDTLESAASLRFEPHPRGYRRNREFNGLHVILGQVDSTTTMHYALNGMAEQRLPLRADSSAQFVSVPLEALDTLAFESLEVRFSGGHPEVNGIGMWADSGVVVHNVAMRGSSGTLFRQLDRVQFTKQLRTFRTELVMLQYGGNTVPYIESAEAAERYGSWFSAQIKLFQTLLPDVPILVIGPSDMARKSGTTMETYPQLTLVRDALKEAALAQDALYWDLFEVMGGEGSMAAWVQSEPPLASPDHIHFTPHGARQVAELLRQSIQTEWTLWQNTQAEQTLVHAN